MEEKARERKYHCRLNARTFSCDSNLIHKMDSEMFIMHPKNFTGDVSDASQ